MYLVYGFFVPGAAWPLWLIGTTFEFVESAAERMEYHSGAGHTACTVRNDAPAWIHPLGCGQHERISLQASAHTFRHYLCVAPQNPFTSGSAQFAAPNLSDFYTNTAGLICGLAASHLVGRGGKRITSASTPAIAYVLVIISLLAVSLATLGDYTGL